MASGRPTGAASEPSGMVLPADQDPSGRGLLLEVAFKTQHMIALGEHARVDRTVWLVTGRAAFAHRFVLEDKRSALSDVALAAGLLFRRKRRAAPNNRLTLVRVVAVRATDPLLRANRTGMRAVEHRMGMREAEFTALVEVAFEAGFGGTVWINDRMRGTAGFFVNAAGAVATLAADIQGIFGFCVQSGVRRGRKAFVDFGVTFAAGCGANELCTRNFRRRNHRAVKGAARE